MRPACRTRCRRPSRPRRRGSTASRSARPSALPDLGAQHGVVQELHAALVLRRARRAVPGSPRCVHAAARRLAALHRPAGSAGRRRGPPRKPQPQVDDRDAVARSCPAQRAVERRRRSALAERRPPSAGAATRGGGRARVERRQDGRRRSRPARPAAARAGPVSSQRDQRDHAERGRRVTPTRAWAGRAGAPAVRPGPRRARPATRADSEREHPRGLGVRAGAEAVEERDRPARVGQPSAPRARRGSRGGGAAGW